MLKSKRLNMVLALIVAIGLWAYVLGEVNPTVTITIKDVPITFLNADTLESEGLTMLSSSSDTVNITISGQRTVVTRVGQGDFTVTADLEALPQGESTIRLSISGPDDVKIEDVSLEKVTVTIDQKVTEEKEITVKVDGDVASDKEPYIVEISKEKVKVTGPKTLVDEVAGVDAVINAGDIGDTMKTIDATLAAVNSKGEQIDNVKLSASKVSVTAVMMDKKTVHLDVPVINSDSGDMERTVSVPKTIVIKGTEDALADITSITCETLDLSQITESTNITLKPILPDGVQLGDESQSLVAKVTVKDFITTTFTFDEGDIKLLNKQEGLTYSIDSMTFDVEASGKESIIKNLAEGDITISADVSGLSPGTYTVALTTTCSKDVSEVTASVGNAEITIQ